MTFNEKILHSSLVDMVNIISEVVHQSTFYDTTEGRTIMLTNSQLAAINKLMQHNVDQLKKI